MSIKLPPVTIVWHGQPDHATVGLAGWNGVVTTIIASPIVGEVRQYINTDGMITHAGDYPLRREDMRRVRGTRRSSTTLPNGPRWRRSPAR